MKRVYFQILGGLKLFIFKIRWKLNWEIAYILKIDEQISDLHENYIIFTKRKSRTD